jgi:hypothetical protein
VARAEYAEERRRAQLRAKGMRDGSPPPQQQQPPPQQQQRPPAPAPAPAAPPAASYEEQLAVARAEYAQARRAAAARAQAIIAEEMGSDPAPAAAPVQAPVEEESPYDATHRPYRPAFGGARAGPDAGAGASYEARLARAREEQVREHALLRGRAQQYLEEQRRAAGASAASLDSAVSGLDLGKYGDEEEEEEEEEELGDLDLDLDGEEGEGEGGLNALERDAGEFVGMLGAMRRLLDADDGDAEDEVVTEADCPEPGPDDDFGFDAYRDMAATRRPRTRFE